MQTQVLAVPILESLHATVMSPELDGRVPMPDARVIIEDPQQVPVYEELTDSNGYCEINIPADLPDPYPSFYLVHAEHADYNPSNRETWGDVAWTKTFYLKSLPPVTVTINTTIGGTTDPTPGAYGHYPGAVERATAIPDGGYGFSHWIHNGLRKTENPLDIPIGSSDETLTAYFIVPAIDRWWDDLKERWNALPTWQKIMIISTGITGVGAVAVYAVMRQG